MLLEFVLLKIPHPEVALGSGAFATWLHAGEFRFLVNLPHMSDVVGALLKGMLIALSALWPPRWAVVVWTGPRVARDIIHSDVVVVPQMLGEVVPALETIGSTVPPAVLAWEALNISAMGILVSLEDIEARVGLLTAFLWTIERCMAGFRRVLA